jgi:HEAT repeat protein
MKTLLLAVALEVCLVAGVFGVAVTLVEAQATAIGDRIAALASPDPSKRAIAACQLSSMGRSAEEAVPALLRLLADATPIAPVNCWSDRTSPGLEAARALGSIRSATAVEPLLEALRSPNPTLRSTAARALGLMMRHGR